MLELQSRQEKHVHGDQKKIPESLGSCDKPDSFRKKVFWFSDRRLLGLFMFDGHFCATPSCLCYPFVGFLWMKRQTFVTVGRSTYSSTYLYGIEGSERTQHTANHCLFRRLCQPAREAASWGVPGQRGEDPRQCVAFCGLFSWRSIHAISTGPNWLLKPHRKYFTYAIQYHYPFPLGNEGGRLKM